MRLNINRMVGALIAYLSVCGVTRADTITIRADDWCPFNCDPSSDKPGFMIEIATKVFEKAGHKVEYSTLNWSRSIKLTREGKFVAIVGAAKDDAPDFVFPDEEQGSAYDSFLVKKGKAWKWDGLASLNNVLLGGAAEYAYGAPIGDYISANGNDSKKVRLITGDDVLRRNIGMLLKDRLDVVIDSGSVIDYFLSENPDLAKEVDHAGHLDQVAIYLAFGPTNPKAKDYAKILSDGVIAMRKSGELATILERYSLTDWK